MPASPALVARHRPRVGRWLIAAFVVITAAVVAAAAAGVIGRPALAAVAGADPRWLFVAALWSVTGYAVAGQALRGAVPQLLGSREAMLLPYAGAAANRVLPAGTGAVAVNTRVLSTRGADVSTALGIATAAAIGTGLAGAVLLTVALVCVGAGVVSVPGFHLAVPHPSGGVLVIAVTATLALATAAVIVVVAARRRKVTTARWHGVHVRRVLDRLAQGRPNGRTVGRFLIFALLSRVTQLGVLLAVTAAVGYQIDVGPGLVVLGAAGVASGLIPVAGGAGGVEATLAIALHAVGLPVPAALAAALLTRLIGYWSPALIGIPALAVLTAHRPRERLATVNTAPVEPKRQRLPLTGVAIAAAFALLTVAGAAAWE